MTTIPRPVPVPAPARAVDGVRVTGRRVVSAEWIKARSARSTWWLLAAVVASLLAAGVSPALTFALGGEGSGDATADATGGALSGVSFTQLVIAALGVVLVSSEYGSGLVRATFTAVPARLPVLVAKALVAAVAAFAASLVALLGAFVAAQAVLAGADVSISLSEPTVLRAIVGAALVLAVSAVLGTAFGWLVRSTAGALAAVFAFLFVLPLLGLLVPGITPYLPSNAGMAILQIGPGAGQLSPWVGLSLFAGYTAAVLGVAGYVLRRRDA
jgi:ABC-type transport system involved in multi-copper enzyme maturation permease subunit